MNSMNELAAALKAAAERVIKNYDSEWFEAGHQICTVHKSKINLISLANPVNVLALVEALEKAQQRIAELESRTVKLPDALLPATHKSGELFMTPDNVEQGGYLNRDDVLRVLRAAGIKVEAE